MLRYRSSCVSRPNHIETVPRPPHEQLERMRQDPRSTVKLIELALAEDRNAIAVLHARGDRAVLNAALALCHSPKVGHRRIGALILGQLGSPKRTFPEECCDALLCLVHHDQSHEVVIQAVFALGHLGNARSEPDLIQLRHHPDRDIRHGVAFALCGAKTPSSVQALLELMEDPYELARDWATTGIGQAVSIDSPEVRAALLRRATDDDEIVRAEALHGLARRHDERVAIYLIAELSMSRRLKYLFVDAAKTFLGIDEAQDTDAEILLSALQAFFGR